MKTEVDYYLEFEPDSTVMRLQRQQAITEYARTKDSLKFYSDKYHELQNKIEKEYYDLRSRVKEEIQYEVAQEIVEFLQLKEVRVRA